MTRPEKLKLPVSLSLLTVLFAGCLTDVPRDNPLDPLAENYAPTAHFEGIITDRTDVGLSGVHVELVLQESEEAFFEQTSTDPDGRFSLSGLAVGAYAMTFFQSRL